MEIISNEQLNNIILEVVEQFLIPKFKELGMNASGKWIESLNVKTTENHSEIWGADYTQYLVNGRANGKRPPINILEQWVNNKFGIHGKQAASIAFAVANKIAKEGTDYYPQGTDLLEVLQSKKCIDFINTRIGMYAVNNVSLAFIRELKKIK